MTERWLDVDGSNGYQVSDDGRVRNRKHRYIHDLVARAFLGDPGIGQEVRHLDGVKSHNVPANLAWGTRSENIRDQVTHGTHRTAGHHPTHFKRGHEFDVANTYLYAGKRHCRRCRAESQYRRKHEVTITPWGGPDEVTF